MSFQLDSLAYTNKLRNIPPIAKVIFSLVNFAIAFFLHPPIQLILALWMGFCVVVFAGISIKFYLKLLMAASIFMLMSLPALIINLVDYQIWELVKNDVWQGLIFGSHYIYLSRQGINQAFTIFCRSFASISCLYFLILSTPFTDILQVLRQWGFPRILTELLLLMYRFIFVLLRTANQLWIAQNSRGGYRTWKTGINSFALLVGQLLQRSLQQYHEFGKGLESRGFNGEIRVYNFHHLCHYNRYQNQRIYQQYLLIAMISWTIFICLEIIYVQFSLKIYS